MIGYLKNFSASSVANGQRAAVLLTIVVLMSACATERQSSTVYRTRQAQGEQSVRLGVVESVRNVTLDADEKGVGTLAGGAIGGIAGSGLGGGNGQIVGAILGAVAGGVAGQSIEKKVNRKPGLEITVRLDNGELVSVVQETDVEFEPGERVRLLSRDGVTRVSR